MLLAIPYALIVHIQETDEYSADDNAGNGPMRSKTSRISSIQTQPSLKQALSKTNADIQPDKPEFADRESRLKQLGGCDRANNG